MEDVAIKCECQTIKIVLDIYFEAGEFLLGVTSDLSISSP